MLAIYYRPLCGNTDKVDSIQPSTDFWQSAIQEWLEKAEHLYNILGPGKMAAILAGSFSQNFALKWNTNWCLLQMVQLTVSQIGSTDILARTGDR